MSAPAAPLTGDELCAAVTDAMLAFHQRYYHREPVTAKTSLLGDDLVACVLGGVYTDVEKTMIESQKETMVQETRNAFQTLCRTSSSTPSKRPVPAVRLRIGHGRPPVSLEGRQSGR
jgi:hypothetical protein